MEIITDLRYQFQNISNKIDKKKQKKFQEKYLLAAINDYWSNYSERNTLSI